MVGCGGGDGLVRSRLRYAWSSDTGSLRRGAAEATRRTQVRATFLCSDRSLWLWAAGAILHRNRVGASDPRSVESSAKRVRVRGWVCRKHDGLEDHQVPQHIAQLTHQARVPFGEAVLEFLDTSLACETCEELFLPNAPHIDLALNGTRGIVRFNGRFQGFGFTYSPRRF